MATAYPCQRGRSRRESTCRATVLAVLGSDHSEGFVFQPMTPHSVFDCYRFIDRPSVRTNASLNTVEGCQQPKFILRHLRPFVQRRLINRKPKRRLQSLPARTICVVGWLSSKTAPVLRLDICGLEMTPTARHNRRGPRRSRSAP